MINNLSPSQAERLLEDAHLADEKEEEEMQRVVLKVYMNLTQCYLQLKEPTRALAYSKKALALDPKNDKCLFLCGRVSKRLPFVHSFLDCSWVHGNHLE